jgi:hypothetical protein
MYYSPFERVLLYFLAVFVVFLSVMVVFFGVSGQASSVSQKWQYVGEECIKNLYSVCKKSGNTQRKMISSRECKLIYDDFVLFGVFECNGGKLYADIWVGRLYLDVKDKEVHSAWAE